MSRDEYHLEIEGENERDHRVGEPDRNLDRPWEENGVRDQDRAEKPLDRLAHDPDVVDAVGDDPTDDAALVLEREIRENAVARDRHVRERENDEDQDLTGRERTRATTKIVRVVRDREIATIEEGTRDQSLETRAVTEDPMVRSRPRIDTGTERHPYKGCIIVIHFIKPLFCSRHIPNNPRIIFSSCKHMQTLIIPTHGDVT